MDVDGRALNWRTVIVTAVLLGLAWWVWRRQGETVPPVEVTPNITPPPVPPPGVPTTLTAKLAAAVDTEIPVVMTSGSPVQYDDDEIKQTIRTVLARVNAAGEYLTLIQVASAAKTVDSYKTVAYDIRANLHDSKENVGLLVSMAVLVPVSGKLYVRSFRLAQDAEETNRGLPGPETAVGFAGYEDPVAILGKTKLP